MIAWKGCGGLSGIGKGGDNAAMSMDIFELFSGAKSPAAILQFLDGSAYDELSEVDLRKDWLHVLYRAEG